MSLQVSDVDQSSKNMRPEHYLVSKENCGSIIWLSVTTLPQYVVVLESTP